MSEATAAQESPAASSSPARTPSAWEALLNTYGDIIFEIGGTLLWSQAGATEVLKRVAKRIRAQQGRESWGALERAWVIQTTVDVARSLEPRIGRHLSPPERMMLDALETPEARLQQLESFFHRLPFERQVLLLLRDKLNLPLTEIARALRTPIESLKIARQQSYRLLEEWIWGDSAPSAPATFRYLTYLSDLLDDTVPADMAEELKRTAKADPECALRLEHARKIRDALNGSRKRALPQALRDTLAQGRIKVIVQDLPRPRSLWNRTPLILRTSLEGLGIGIGILAVVSITPRIRVLYERSVEKRLEAISLGDLVMPNEGDEEILGGGANSTPLTRGKNPALASAEGEAEDDFDGEDEDREAEKPANKKGDDKLRVGSSEIWRFNLKTDSPREMRAKVVQILGDLRLPADTPGLGGIEAPGGIQFDLYVPTWAVSSLKNQLQRMAAPNQRSVLSHRPSHSAIDNTSISDLFTWYRNKSRRKVPAGKARVVIWLSQT